MSDLKERVLLRRYRVDEFLGRGGMAEVYRAWDAKRSVYVALKVLNEDLAEDYVFLRRFAREAHALELLQHPHIIRFFGFEETDDTAFLVMEYIDGVTLRRQLKLLGRPLALPEALAVLHPVCSALHYAHGMGIYHCDVKPANIFVERGGRVVLGDFGIARLSESATVTFSTPGTPAYMAPEQCRGEEVDARTDIYGLGIATYEMLTLDRPFKGDIEEATGSRGERVRWEQMNVPPPRPSSVNRDISPVAEVAILRALEKEPERRQRGALEFYDGLSEQGRVQAADTSVWATEGASLGPPPVPNAESVAVPSIKAQERAAVPLLVWGVVGAVGLVFLAAIVGALLGGGGRGDDADRVATLAAQITAGAQTTTAEVSLHLTATSVPSVGTPTPLPTAVRPTEALTNTPDPTATAPPPPTDTAIPPTPTDMPRPTDTPVPHTPTNTPRPTDTPVPPSPSGLVVEDAEGYDSDAALSASYNINDAWGANEGSLSIAGLPHIGGGAQAIAFWFNIRSSAPDDYSGFDRRVQTPQDWSGHSHLCLWVENDGSLQEMVVQFGEWSGEVWKRMVSLSVGTQEVCLPLSESTFYIAEWSPTDNGQIDLEAISYHGVYVHRSQPGSGTVYIDEIRVANR